MSQFFTVIGCLAIVTWLAYENRDLKESNAALGEDYTQLSQTHLDLVGLYGDLTEKYDTLQAEVPKRDKSGKFAKKAENA